MNSRSKKRTSERECNFKMRINREINKVITFDHYLDLTEIKRNPVPSCNTPTTDLLPST